MKLEKIKQALNEIKTLRGILPLCSYCHRVRNDKGYWEKVDIYIRHHTEADISHSICPECKKKHYPEYLNKTCLPVRFGLFKERLNIPGVINIRRCEDGEYKTARGYIWKFKKV